jgi:hypothetical protein
MATRVDQVHVRAGTRRSFWPRGVVCARVSTSCARPQGSSSEAADSSELRIKTMKNCSVVLVSSLATCLASPVLAPVLAQEPLIAPSTGSFHYAAKFLCTTNTPFTSAAVPSVVPGHYLTVINIHNPHDQAVQFREKIALTFPPGGQKPGEVSNFVDRRLAPDEALSVDCDGIKGGFGLTFVHGAEGFLVIESPRSLDVTAVYTAGKVEGEVDSIAVEQIRERRK